jgi:phosphonate transport system permease protein
VSRPGVVDVGPERAPRELSRRLALYATAVAWIILIVGSASYTLRTSGEALISRKTFINFGSIVLEMLPPDVSIVRSLRKPMVETVAMSVMATLLAAASSFPLGFLAARSTTPHPVVSYLVKGSFNALRTIPELILAIIFVASVGFGILPGILALAVHSAGMLGKFFAETIEKADPGLAEAVASCGGSRFHVIVFGIVPQILAHAVDYTLYRWEHNFRASAVVGMVGAGGIGFELVSSLRLLQYRQVSAILIVVFVVVQLVDGFGNAVRARLLGRSA